MAEAWQQWQPQPVWEQLSGGRAAWIANILLFLPVGFFLAGGWLLDQPWRRRSLSWHALLLAVIVAFAALLEIAQLWFPDREASQLDILADVSGGLLGVLLWSFAGESFVEWIRGWARDTTQPTVFDRLLVVYLLVCVFWSLYPMDMTVSLGSLYHKYLRGQVHLIPLAEVSGDLAGVARTLGLAALFVPIGILVATWRAARELPVRSWWFTMTGGILCAGGLELLQLMVRSRSVSSTDVICGALGIVLGGWIASRRSNSAGLAWRTSLTSPAVRCAVCLVGCTLYGLLLTLAYSSLFDLAPREAFRDRYENFYHLPIVESSPGQSARSSWELIREGLVFAPLGCFLGCALASVAMRFRRAAAVVLFSLAVAFAFGLEMLQIMLPSHVPDITDLLMYVWGTLVGLMLTKLLPAAAVEARERKQAVSSTLSEAR
jgi:glycopeptide antibiotics resistance protein